MLGVGFSNILQNNREGYQITPHTQLSCSLDSHLSRQEISHAPKEQHDGRGLVGRRGERHTQLKHPLQELPGDVEAVIVDAAAQEDVAMGRILL